MAIILYLTLTLIFLTIVKYLKSSRGAIYRFIGLSDVNWSAFLSLILWFVSDFIKSDTASLAILIMLLILGLILIIDAALFVQYKIEVNIQTVKWFMSGSKGILKGSGHFWNFFWGKPLSFGGFIFLFAIFLYVFFYDRFFSQSNVLIATGKECLDNILILPFTLALLLLNLVKMSFRPKSSFFNISSIISSLFVHPKLFKLPKVNNNDLNTLLRPSEQKKSAFFSSCSGANVILFTVESMGNYIATDNGKYIRSRLVERFQNGLWYSKAHYSLCPNTTVSTNQIYTGKYSNNPYNKADSVFYGGEPEHLTVLKRLGYKTMFLDSADIKLYNYDRLLKRIGFDRIWGTDDLPAKRNGDYRLLDMVEPIVKEIEGDKPFFLHVINDQTHMPYQIIDKKKFNRFKGDGKKSEYLNALDEVDFILSEFLKKLERKVDLSNTIMILTGDHGESFGEFGYYFHSNSVVPEQITVPFWLQHQKLPSRLLEHSSHFDLFPTIFDLLGIEYSHFSLGRSLGLNERERPCEYFFHSATLKGNTPANFSLIQNDTMIWLDKFYGKSRVFKHNNTQWNECISHGNSKDLENRLWLYLYENDLALKDV
ncbi:sulfatase-like hydrolase/transferase [Catenovulum sediminis]|uniref:sulfatase-like hydrolase/transferase n=1 Tax=Catenovulum sediminis TaxID=1740262 RepID=UPI00117BE1E4|nr:sulfatase-like hydrolase/transferase [Catenovulum sediminis]